jgi:SAM-dependent methyltransferase
VNIEAMFRCPVCSAGGLFQCDSAVECDACGTRFPEVGGIPLLTKNPAGHDSAIREAQTVNPQWYLVEQLAEEVSPWRHHLRKRRHYVEQVLRRELSMRGAQKAARLLDLGCGDGNNLRWLMPYAKRLYGSDYNLLRIVRAQKRSREATLFLADLLNYPVFDNSFDVIFFNHVIEHIPRDVVALKEVRRILSPGGLLVLGTPNEGAWWWQLAYRRSPKTLADTDHIHFYTAEMICRRMRSVGFHILEVKHLGWGLPDWRLDGRLRQFELLDDLFEMIGRLVIPNQASSLYIIAT